MKKFTLLTFTMILLVCGNILGQVPKTLSYQGLLTNLDGTNLADGDYSLKFSLYDVDTGSEPLWEEVQVVSLTKGIFSVILGKTTELNLPFTNQYWLGISVENEAEMTPRTELTSSAYSLSASANGGLWNQNDYGISQLEGNVGIGTDMPMEKLEVNNGSVRISNTGDFNAIVNRPFVYLNQIGESNFGGGLIWQDESVNQMEMFYQNDSREIIFYNSLSGYIAAIRDSGSLWLNNMIEPSGIKFRDGSLLTSANNGIGGRWSNNAENIFFNSGNVGIGTEMPMATLHVAGTLAVNGDNENLFIVGTDGHVGIGAEPSGEKLLISGGLQTEGEFGYFRTHPYFTPGNGTALLGTFYAEGNGPQLRFFGARDGFMDIGEDSLGNFVVEGNDNIFLSVSTTGNVGIGTNMPDWSLDITHDSPFGTWSAIRNTSEGGRQWAFISSGSANTEGTGKFLIRDSAADKVRMTFDTDGNVGIGTSDPTHPLEMASGAHVTAGGVWTNASSRSLKENITELSSGEAFGALSGLNPVKYNYLSEKDENYVGFIAEDVPEMVAMKDRKSLSPMDIVALLTKVVQEQQKSIEGLTNELEQMKKILNLK